MQEPNAYFDEADHSAYQPPAEPSYGYAPAEPERNPAVELADSAQRQEAILGKLLEVVTGLAAEVKEMKTSMRSMEERIAELVSVSKERPVAAAAPPLAAPAPVIPGVGALGPAAVPSYPAAGGAGRGSMLPPPGRQAGGSMLPPPGRRDDNPDRLAAQQRAQEEREAQIRRREEEERKRREAEEQRRRLEEERRRLEEEKRLAEQRRIEEEKERKRQELADKTRGLMDGLMAGGGDSDLFGAEAPAETAASAAKAKGKSLFDD